MAKDAKNAKDPKVSEGEAAEGAAKSPRRRRGILLLVVGCILGGGGVGGYFAYQHFVAGASAEAPLPEPEPTVYGPLHQLAPIVANLTDRSAGRFVRVTLHLEAKDDEALVTVVEREVPIRHRLLIYFSELNPERAHAPGGKDALREELVTAVNEVIGAELVRRVYFSEFVLQ